MTRLNEIYEKVDPKEDENLKGSYVDTNEYSVEVEIGRDTNYFTGISIYIYNKKTENGFSLRINKDKLSIDHCGGKIELQQRTYEEWFKLEQLEKAVKLINSLK